ncbi:MAG: hypothetical protein WD673_01265 [Alphaproteobacteria bacterium]
MAEPARDPDAMPEDSGIRRPCDEPPKPCFTRTYRLLARGTNISDETLLATDYLNHANEVIMLIELLGAAPEFIDDVRAWRPISYAEHFRESGFVDRELAICAYDQAPIVYRVPFDGVIAELMRPSWMGSRPSTGRSRWAIRRAWRARPRRPRRERAPWSIRRARSSTASPSPRAKTRSTRSWADAVSRPRTVRPCPCRRRCTW